MYSIKFSKQAEKDWKLIRNSGLEKKVNKILLIITENPYHYSHSYEKLNNNLEGKYSRRITLQHRLVYEIDEENKVVSIIRMWSHYEHIIKEEDLLIALKPIITN